MGNLDLGQLEILTYVFVGLVLLIVIGLIVYLVLAGRKSRPSPGQYIQEDLVIRPEHRVVGQVMSLVRDGPGAALQVEFEGKRYRTLAEVQDPDMKRQIVATAMELIQFTGVLDSGSLAPAPLEKTETWREDLRSESRNELQLARDHTTTEVPAQPASQEIEDQFLSMLAELGVSPSQIEKPGVIGAVRQRFTPRLPDTAQPRTFVDDIEDIVQRRVPLTPAMVGRGLHIRSGQDGKVVFEFEGNKYTSVEAIPNLTARQLIQDSIQEWEETA
jgi:hypothetical protein